MYFLQRYLEKYGYLKKNCTSYVRQKRNIDFRSSILSDSEVLDEVPLENKCSHADIRKAVLLMQYWFKLNQTGELDEVTVKQMNLKRCGNPEYPNQADTDMKNQDDEASTDSKDSTTSRVLHKRSIYRVEEGYPTDIRTVPGKTVTMSEVQKQRKYSKLYRILTKSAKLRKEDLYFKGVSPRRKKYLEMYIKKAIASDRKFLFSSEKDLIRIRKLMHLRRKRSSLVEETPHGVKFKENSIRWRLLKSSSTSFISYEHQRSILHLAFRMWSEVTPLKFVEDPTSNVQFINVEIGFVKGE